MSVATTMAGPHVTQARPFLRFLLFTFSVTVCALYGPSVGSPPPAVMANVLVASILSSIAGFAFSAIAGAILFHLVDDQVQVVQIMVVCSIANQATMVWAVRRNIDWRTLTVFLMGGFAGLPFGVWALLHSDRHVYLSALGVLLLAYSIYMLSRRERTLPLHHPALDALAGLLGGITGGAAAFPSGPVTILCQLRGADKVSQRALFQPFIVVMQVGAMALLPLINGQANGRGLDPAILFCVPAGLFGTWLGMACFRRMSNKQFGLAVNVLLIISGLSFLL